MKSKIVNGVNLRTTVIGAMIIALSFAIIQFIFGYFTAWNAAGNNYPIIECKVDSNEVKITRQEQRHVRDIEVLKAVDEFNAKGISVNNYKITIMDTVSRMQNRIILDKIDVLTKLIERKLK